MNARSQVFEVVVDARQIEESVLSLFHTILFHRTLGKFSYQHESSYCMGAIGYEDVDCDYIDHTYVRAQSPSLDLLLRTEVSNFGQELRLFDSKVQPQHRKPYSASGQVSLEFYQKKRRWPFTSENIPWEVWTVRTELVSPGSTEEGRRRWRERVGEVLSDKVMYIAEVMNRRDFVPKPPTEADLELVFDTTFSDVQPYLFKISHVTSGLPSSPSVGTTMRRLIKDTLAI